MIRFATLRTTRVYSETQFIFAITVMGGGMWPYRGSVRPLTLNGPSSIPGSAVQYLRHVNFKFQNEKILYDMKETQT